MPAQKRLFEEEEEEENGALNGEMNHEENKEDVLESDRSPSENNGDKDDEFVVIKLSDVRKEVQCPICLGIIRKTRTVMECLHRFCRECIDKSMRLGNNECPTCRTHCPSRRSLRDDPNYDALIAALYPEIDKYEQEEFALQEYEKALNQQIQESISQTLQRKSEALGKKRYPKSRTKRSQGNYRTSHVRARRNGRSTVELQGSDDTEGMKDEDGAKGSSGDELIEIRSKRCKRGAEAQFSPHSPTTAADDGSDENAPEVSREFLSPSRALAWGKNGHRSHTRVNGKNARNSRLAKLIDNLRSLEENDNELGVCLMLVPFDEKRMPSLQQPYLYCRPTLSVRHLCQYVSLQTAVQADEVEICLVKEQQANIIRAAGSVDLCKNNLQVLKEQETLADLKPDNFSCGHLLMAYKRRLLNSTATSLR